MDPLVLDFANRFEAVAADAMDGHPHAEGFVRIAGEVKARGGDLPARVAEAVTIMAGWIEESDDGGRFVRKVALLREAAALLKTP